jgi:predicted Zn-dependent peptidase
MNNRLNLSLREKYGLVYGVEANYNAFTDTGVFQVLYSTENRHLKKSTQLVMKELKKLREVPLGRIQLTQLKEQIKGNLAMAEESNVSLMQMLARSILDLGYVDTLDDMFVQIDQVTAMQLADLANEVFNEDQFSMLTYIPQQHGVS